MNSPRTRNKVQDFCLQGEATEVYSSLSSWPLRKSLYPSSLYHLHISLSQIVVKSHLEIYLSFHAYLSFSSFAISCWVSL